MPDPATAVPARMPSRWGSRNCHRTMDQRLLVGSRHRFARGQNVSERMRPRLETFAAGIVRRRQELPDDLYEDDSVR